MASVIFVFSNLKQISLVGKPNHQRPIEEGILGNIVQFSQVDSLQNHTQNLFCVFYGVVIKSILFHMDNSSPTPFYPPLICNATFVSHYISLYILFWNIYFVPLLFVDFCVTALQF